MVTDYVAERKSFYEDIKDEGFLVVIRTPGTPPEWSDIEMKDIGGTDPIDEPTYAIRKEYSQKDIDGQVVEMNDSLLVIPALGITEDFKLKNEVLIDDVKQNVINIKPIAPANIRVGYFVQVRSLNG